jgi:His/Glu/Gln/Arg/opine family amino acid ABC transporter permease subunit
MDFAVILPHLPQFAKGIVETLKITGLGLLTSLSFALVLLAASERGGASVRWVVRGYVGFILGMPILTLLYVIYFAGPPIGIRLDAWWAGVLTLTLYYSPYMAEAMRGAVAAIPPGQTEAARTVGLSEATILRRIIAPQALGILLPALAGLSIGLAKDTAILSVISVREFAYETRQVVAQTYAPAETWVVVALTYWVLLSTLDFGVRRLERRVNHYRPTGSGMR